MQITSTVFDETGAIPARFTCQGENHNPPLTISDVPENAVSLALIMDDPDAATDPHGPGHTYDHWIVWNIPASMSEIPENTSVGSSGSNSSGERGYIGPCPPTGEHRYLFRIYALDCELTLKDADKETLQGAMRDHILDEAVLVGHYKKS